MEHNLLYNLVFRDPSYSMSFHTVLCLNCIYIYCCCQLAYDKSDVSIIIYYNNFYVTYDKSVVSIITYLLKTSLHGCDDSLATLHVCPKYVSFSCLV